MTSLTNSTSSLSIENLDKEVEKYGEFDKILFGVSFAFHIKDKSFNKLTIIRPQYGGFETALKKNNDLVYLRELGYEDVSYFQTKEEVLTEIIRLGKSLRPLPTAPVEVKVGQVWKMGSHLVLVTLVQKVWVTYEYVDPNRANYEGSHPLYRWHKDCVFVEQREVEEKDEDYMFVSDDSDEESSSDEDEEEEIPQRKKKMPH